MHMLQYAARPVKSGRDGVRFGSMEVWGTLECPGACAAFCLKYPRMASGRENAIRAGGGG